MSVPTSRPRRAAALEAAARIHATSVMGRKAARASKSNGASNVDTIAQDPKAVAPTAKTEASNVQKAIASVTAFFSSFAEKAESVFNKFVSMVKGLFA